MKSNIFKRGFAALIATQFFGAANDNILKGVLIFMLANGLWQGALGAGGQGWASALFTLPFIFLSGYAGRFADRHSKRSVTVLVKCIEIPIALIGMVGFWMQNLWITLGALIALACQSAFFGPAKYGMIPELVEKRDLSRANGAINMMTNIAVIVGTLAAGQIAVAYFPNDEAPQKPLLCTGVTPDETPSQALPNDEAPQKPLLGTGVTPGETPSQALPNDEAPQKPLLWLPGVIMILVAIAGLVCSLLLPRLKEGDKSIQYELNPFTTYISSLKEMNGTPLFTVMFSWAYFYLLAGLALLAIPDYEAVLESYDVDAAEVAVLMGVMGIAIGLGCVLAGLISGHAIRPRLILVGAAGLIFFFAMLGMLPAQLPDLPRYWRVLFSWISFAIVGAGIFAGFYIIPLQAMLQRLTPEDELGRYLGTANGLSFTFILLASLLYSLLLNFVFPHDQAQRTFLVCAILMAIGLPFFIWRVKARGFSFDRFE